MTCQPIPTIPTSNQQALRLAERVRDLLEHASQASPSDPRARVARALAQTLVDEIEALERAC